MVSEEAIEVFSWRLCEQENSGVVWPYAQMFPNSSQLESLRTLMNDGITSNLFSIPRFIPLPVYFSSKYSEDKLSAVDAPLWLMARGRDSPATLMNICNFLVHLYCFVLNSANEMMQMISAAVPSHLHFISLWQFPSCMILPNYILQRSTNVSLSAFNYSLQRRESWNIRSLPEKPASNWVAAGRRWRGEEGPQF